MSDDFGIYIHIPFCVRKCLYCDFLSFSGAENVYEDYINTLCKEIRNFKGEISHRTIDTVFVGGGTPSAIPTKMLGRVMGIVTDELNIGGDAEITMELNPGMATAESLSDYRSMGINRLSIGLQAWQDRHLKTLGRIHTKEKFVETYYLARKAGFRNINTDIMFSLPGQTMTDIEETLENIVKLAPEHISAYSLIIEEGTPFKKMFDSGVFKETDEKLDRDMYAFICGYLKEYGYNRYEISNFSKKGFESRHNSIYWRTNEYIGFGLGAHSYFNGERFHNTCDMDEYLKSRGEHRKKDVEVLTQEDKISEFMFMGLRMDEGVSKEKFKRRFNSDIRSIYREVIDKYKNMGMIRETEDTISLTDKGIDVSNVIFGDFLI